MSEAVNQGDTAMDVEEMMKGFFILGGDDNPLADAIMDRISYDSYKINIESSDPQRDISMREVYGLDPAQAK